MSESATPDPATNPRRMFVGFMIALTVTVFVLTSGLLYYRWMTMVEPTCVLVVESTSSLRGAEVEVDGVTLPKPHKVTMGSGERFALPFYLEPGDYTVKVTMNESVLFEAPLKLTPEAPGRRLDLTQLQPPPPRVPTTTMPSRAS